MYKVKRFSQITEERQYTRAEKQAFLELYKATGGLRHLPKGSSPRDVHRFNKFATDLKKMSLGDYKGFDRENAKQLLENTGLHKSASQVDKMIDKYTNKRALARLSRMKNRKGNEIDYDGIRPLFNKSSKIMNKGASISDESKAAFDKMHEINKPDSASIDKLTKYAKKNDIDVVRTSNHPDFSSKYDSMIETMPDMSKTLEGADGKKYVGRVIQNTGALEGDLAHEIGHVKTYKSATGKELKKLRNLETTTPQLFNRNSRGKAFLDDKSLAFQKTTDKIVDVANENSATAYGNALLKKMRSPRLKMNEENLGHSLSSYMGAAANHGGYNARTSLKWT